MEIDIQALKEISKNKTNKDINGFDDSILLSSLLKLLSNLIYTTSNFTVNEISLFVYSLNNWLKRKSYRSTVKYKIGDIIEFDCGLNFYGELSYRHTGIILDVTDKMVLTAPTTSTSSYIDKTSEKEKGIWYYKLVGKSEGFDHNCALMLNNMKMISKCRIITSYGNMTDTSEGKKYFDDIKFEILKHYFSKQYSFYESKILDLESMIDEKDEQIEDLRSKNKDLMNKIEEQKDKISHFYTRKKKKSKKTLTKANDNHIIYLGGRPKK